MILPALLLAAIVLVILLQQSIIYILGFTLVFIWSCYMLSSDICYQELLITQKGGGQIRLRSRLKDQQVLFRLEDETAVRAGLSNYSVTKKEGKFGGAIIALCGEALIIVAAFVMFGYLHGNGSFLTRTYSDDSRMISETTASVSQTPMPTPYNTPTPEKSRPGPDDMTGADSRVEVPEHYAWLEDYETRYVFSPGGYGIYLRYGPSQSSNNFDTILDSTAVTVLADQAGYSLVIAPGRKIGWCRSDSLYS